MKYNLFLIANITCIIIFVLIPIYVWIFKTLSPFEAENFNLKLLVCFGAGFVELFLVDALMTSIKEHNRPF